MKDLDGIAACRQMKAMDPAARIVLVSDYDGAAMRESARHAGACGYVLKDNLLEVRGLLSGFSARDWQIR
jgi:DNA-binding NarL/FixJ family response regulator